MIKWKLREVMARHKITGRALAEELKVSSESISKLRTSDSMPRINGEKIEQILSALSKLSGEQVIFADLYEEKPRVKSQEQKTNFKNPIAV